MRGVTKFQLHVLGLEAISTRTPHAGSDDDLRQPQQHDAISTRTPHAGSDLDIALLQADQVYFNPHSPCGE